MHKEVLPKKRAEGSDGTSKARTIGKGPGPRPIYALRQWTVERRRHGWYIRPTHAHFTCAAPWTGPYSTLESACLAISRKLAREVRDRYRRQYGVEEGSANGSCAASPKGRTA